MPHQSSVSTPPPRLTRSGIGRVITVLVSSVLAPVASLAHGGESSRHCPITGLLDKERAAMGQQ